MNRLASLPVFSVAFIAGIYGASLFAWNLPFLYTAGAVLCLAAVALLSRKPKRALVCTILFFALIGMILGIQADTVLPHHISRFVGQNAVVVGQVEEQRLISSGEENQLYRYIVEVHSIRMTDASRAATGRINLLVRHQPGYVAYDYGDVLQVKGKLLELHGFHNPGMVDNVAALKRQDIGARMMVTSDGVTIISGQQGWMGRIAAWRSSLSALFLSVMPASDAAILNGVIFGGGYSSIRPEVLSEFSRTGIIHILSVSGSHISLVTAVMLWLCERLRFNRLVKTLIALAAMMGYAVLAGLTPPVIRSVIMGAAALVALLSNREQYGAGALSLAAILMLAWNPLLIYDISFQLSFTGTAGLVFLYGKIRRYINFLPSWLASGIAVTVAAQVGMLPFLAWYFKSLPLGSIPASLLVVPVIEGVIVLGLAACVMGVVFTGAAKFILVACSLLLGLAVSLNSIITALPGLQLYVPPFSLGMGLCYYLVISWLAGYLAMLPSFHRIVFYRPWITAGAAAVAVVAVSLYLSIPRPAEVHFIDVGQGDATLVLTPRGRAVLIDAGGTSGGVSRFDIGERIVVPYLRHQGVRTVDYLVLTHGHQDHAGGAAAVASAIPVSNILIAPEPLSDSITSLMRLRQGSAVIPVSEGQTVSVDGVEISVLYAGNQSNGVKRGGNENSSLIGVRYGNHSFLITGDLDGRQELSALSKGLQTATVLKVAHHGSRTSSIREFLQTVKPRYAVISVGAGNRFGHPHTETLRRLDEAGAVVYRTDRQGAICFRTDGTTITVQPFLSP